MYYFSLSQEPSIKILVPISLLALFALIKYRNRLPLYILFSILLFFFLGVLFSSCKTLLIASPKLHERLNYAKVSGQVEKIYPLEKGKRIILKSVIIGADNKNYNFEKIQLTVKTKGDFKIGDHITLRAALYPNSSVLFPDKYDFARHAYFNKIAANGYAMSYVSISNESPKLSIFDKIERLRQHISTKLNESMPTQSAGVAAALMIGEQRSIDKTVLVELRKSGLSHILSVSGMHLSLVSIICFFVTRYVMSNFVSFAQMYNTKKIAAWISLFITLGYFLISGLQIAALRAFIMVAFVILAVILDREEDSKRSVCFAAFFILLVLPESVFQPSFQMSFSAVLILVTAYEFYVKKNHSTERSNSIFSKIWRYFFGVLFSSLAAGLATSMSVIFHFGNYSNYSVIANLLAAPIVSIIIMPAVMLTFLLLPFGLHKIPIFLLNIGIEMILKIAKYISDFALSTVKFPPISIEIFLVFTVGFLWLCLWQSRWRFLGAVPILASLIMLYMVDFPSIIIDAKHKVVLIKDGKNLLKIGGKKVLSKSQKDQWTSIMDIEKIDKLNNSSHYNFDYNGYILELNFFENSTGAMEFENLRIANAQEQNNKLAITTEDLKNRGSYFIYLRENSIKYKYAVSPEDNRPWSQPHNPR